MLGGHKQSRSGGDGADAVSFVPILILVFFLCLLPDQLRGSVPLVRPGSAVPVLQVLPAGQDQLQRRPGCSRGPTPAAQDGLQRQGDAAVLCPGDDFRIHRIITYIVLNLFRISG